MRNLLLFLTITLISCSPATKQDALPYYIKIKYEISMDVLIRLDEQKESVMEYLRNPSKLTTGPNSIDHKQLLNAQRELIPLMKNCISKLEEVSPLGDKANYLESLLKFMKIRLNLEKGTMLRIVEALEDGMTPEESSFMGNQINEVIKVNEQQILLNKADENFLKEFSIGDSELEKKLIEIGY